MADSDSLTPRRFLLDLEMLAIAAYNPLPMRKPSTRFIIVEEIELIAKSREQTQPVEDWRIAAQCCSPIDDPGP